MKTTLTTPTTLYHITFTDSDATAPVEITEIIAEPVDPTLPYRLVLLTDLPQQTQERITWLTSFGGHNL